VEDKILNLLKSAKTIAVVGLSDDPSKPSYGVSAYMQKHGYRIIPINPKLKEALGERSYPTLRDAAKEEKIDVVDVFRRPEAVPEIVDEVLELKIPALWLQETVVHEAAARKAEQAGVQVVMDRCILKEHSRRGL
jgi:uncharacterized protein